MIDRSGEAQDAEEESGVTKNALARGLLPSCAGSPGLLPREASRVQTTVKIHGQEPGGWTHEGRSPRASARLYFLLRAFLQGDVADFQFAIILPHIGLELEDREPRLGDVL